MSGAGATGIAVENQVDEKSKVNEMEERKGKTARKEIADSSTKWLINRQDVTSESSSLKNTGVERVELPRSTLPKNGSPLVLSTHIVPSLPIELFELLAEVIESVTGTPVALLYEPRSDRPVAKNVADIAILPARGKWEEAVLLPVSPIFDHRLNKDMSARVFVDVVITADISSRVQDLLDLRGLRCALPDRDKCDGATALLFDHLRLRGESPAFFGDTLDTDSQLAALDMVVRKRTEVCVLESPVLNCYKSLCPRAMKPFHILTSLGSLPPYRIMISERAAGTYAETISKCLMNISGHKTWLEKFASFGILGFAANSEECYNFDNTKSVVTSVPYY